MADSLSPAPRRGRASFRQIADSFLSQPGLPFAEILSAERIERIFAKHAGLFGANSIYSTAVMVWSFLGQVLRDGKEASCQSAVARVVTHCELLGQSGPTDDTGDYCRARAKLPASGLREICCEVGSELQQAAPAGWLWKWQRHAKLIDGFTFTMPDTAENQAEFPQPKSQQPGVGLPLARAVGILSLATACVLNAAIGPHAGKETGESALLRTILTALLAGDVAVFDRYCCSFMMIALLHLQGTDVCTRLHQKRRCDFRRGRRLGEDDHVVVWTRPERPEWMDEATYERIPATLELRELRYQIVEKGRRTKSLIIVTTLTDAQKYTKQDVAELYGFRWNVELDIRHIKSSLNLGHLRCKTPDMVRREFWTTLLAYNLIRTTAAAAALLHNKQPRQISFTSTCQYVLSAWMYRPSHPNQPVTATQFCLCLLTQIANCLVANRPGRLEPRVLKRRRHGYKLMQKPRATLRAELRKNCT
jgi:putative transposase